MKQIIYRQNGNGHSIWTRYRKARAAALSGIPMDYRDAKNAPVNFHTRKCTKSSRNSRKSFTVLFVH